MVRKGYCCVPGCKNTSEKNPDLAFHCMPKPDHLRKEWLANIGTPELFVKPYSTLNWMRVCSKHFTVDQYQYLGSKRLYPGAIPTIVAPSTLTLPAKLSAHLREAIHNAEDTPATELPGTSGIPVSLEPPMPGTSGLCRPEPSVVEILELPGLQNVPVIDVPGTSGLSRPEPKSWNYLNPAARAQKM